MIRKSLAAAAAFLVVPILAASAAMSPAQVAVLDQYVAVAKAEPGYAGPSAERGRAFFFASHAGGKSDTLACTACHSRNLTWPGQTRAGKPIEPMAPSVVPTRYTDAATVEKCSSAIAVTCSAASARPLKRPTY